MANRKQNTYTYYASPFAIPAKIPSVITRTIDLRRLAFASRFSAGWATAYEASASDAMRSRPNLFPPAISPAFATTTGEDETPVRRSLKSEIAFPFMFTAATTPARGKSIPLRRQYFLYTMPVPFCKGTLGTSHLHILLFSGLNEQR